MTQSTPSQLSPPDNVRKPAQRRRADDDGLLLLRLQLLKRRGDHNLQHQNYRDAIDRYTEALDQIPTMDLQPSPAGASAASRQIQGELLPALLSNRSQALCRAARHQGALLDAQRLCALRPTWPKARFRVARALEGLQQYAEAARQYIQAHRLEPGGDPSCVSSAGAAIHRLTCHKLAEELLALAQQAVLSQGPSRVQELQAVASCPRAAEAARKLPASEGGAAEQLPLHPQRAPLASSGLPCPGEGPAVEPASLERRALLHVRTMDASQLVEAVKALIWEDLRQPPPPQPPPQQQQTTTRQGSGTQAAGLYGRLLEWLLRGQAPAHEALQLLASAWLRSRQPEAAAAAAAAAASRTVAMLLSEDAPQPPPPQQQQLIDPKSGTPLTATSASPFACASQLPAGALALGPTSHTAHTSREQLMDFLAESHFLLGSAYLELAAKPTASVAGGENSADARPGPARERLLLAAAASFVRATALAPGRASFQAALLQASAAAGDGDAVRRTVEEARRLGPLVLGASPLPTLNRPAPQPAPPLPDSLPRSPPAVTSADSAVPSTVANQADGTAAPWGLPSVGAVVEVAGCLGFPGRGARDLTGPARAALIRGLLRAACPAATDEDGTAAPSSFAARIDRVEQRRQPGPAAPEALARGGWQPGAQEQQQPEGAPKPSAGSQPPVGGTALLVHFKVDLAGDAVAAHRLLSALQYACRPCAQQGGALGQAVTGTPQQGCALGPVAGPQVDPAVSGGQAQGPGGDLGPQGAAGAEGSNAGAPEDGGVDPIRGGPDQEGVDQGDASLVQVDGGERRKVDTDQADGLRCSGAGDAFSELSRLLGCMDAGLSSYRLLKPGAHPAGEGGAPAAPPAAAAGAAGVDTMAAGTASTAGTFGAAGASAAVAASTGSPVHSTAQGDSGAPDQGLPASTPESPAPLQYRLVSADGRPYEGPQAGMPKHPFCLSRVYYDSKELPSLQRQAWCELADGSCRWRQSASELHIIALRVPRGLPGRRLQVRLGPHLLEVKDKLTGQVYLSGRLYRGVLPDSSSWTVEPHEDLLPDQAPPDGPLDLLSVQRLGGQAGRQGGAGTGEGRDPAARSGGLAAGGRGGFTTGAAGGAGGGGCFITLGKMNLELLARSWRHAEVWWCRLFEGHADLQWDDYEKDYSDLPPHLLQQHMEQAARQREQGHGGEQGDGGSDSDSDRE